MSSLAEVQSVLKSSFSSSEFHSSYKKNQTKMAKIALALFLFALFAVAMSARVAREEPAAEVDPLEQFRIEINNAITKIKNMNGDKVKEIISEGIGHIQEGLNKVTEVIQPKPTSA
ncbi:neuropeptide-like 2 [Drosophila santomea]|uniref:neuropeptide-like 2 n=1 Tax=Drosophila santomea TaxID=129105 RepID=UPI0019535C97|nr:neuropeptide-like 2 [Drosophila santomea]